MEPTLPARLHSAGAGQGGAATHKHMRNQPCRPDRTRQVAGQGGAATHKHMRNQPCRPDRTRQVAGQGGAETHKHMWNQPCRSGRSCDTQTHAEPTLPARPHSAGHRSGRGRDTHTCGTNPPGQTALGRSPVREEPQHICMRPILLMRPHSKCVYSTSSPLWMQSLSKHYKMPQVYPEVVEWSDKKKW